MIHLIETRTFIPEGYTCDVCGKKHLRDDADFQAQEFVNLTWTAGFGSLLEDGSGYEINICQVCFHKAFGKFIRKVYAPVEVSAKGVKIQFRDEEMTELVMDKKLAKGDILHELYMHVGNVLSSGNYYEITSWLDKLETELIRTEVLLGILTITLSWDEVLPSRRDFLERVRDTLQASFSSDYIERLLEGL